jgi:AcrR family transcriptional regulator
MPLANQPVSDDRAPAAPGSPEGRRRYRSPLRKERATDTSRRIAAAASELFAEHGFGATTVTTIAERAGVSAQTVYAIFGSKGAILQALLAKLEEDADAARWRARIAAETSPCLKLEAFAQWSAGMFSTSKAVIAAAQGAAGDPAILALRTEADRHRREALRTLVDGLSKSGALRAGLTRRRAVDRAWMLTGVELYLAAIDGCGWSDTAYAQWLAGLLVGQLLASDSEAPAGATTRTPVTR